MSMLAESRRKKKWSVDPQGKRWSKDSNKIGQKLLEKMGWTPGKGLGVNEQGNVEHVRVNMRNSENEKAGLGYDRDVHMNDEHQNKFNNFLQQLVNHHNQEKSIENSGNNKLEIRTENNKDVREQSLELKSKHSRARVRYQKYLRGKDVSKYSTKDLANIFGKKELNNGTEVNIKENNSICENKALIDTSSRTSHVVDSANTVYNPWNKKERMTKKTLKRLFYGNLVTNFPGSNIQDIKGYGADTIND